MRLEIEWNEIKRIEFVVMQSWAQIVQAPDNAKCLLIAARPDGCLCLNSDETPGWI